jgi:hypothetical protein
MRHYRFGILTLLLILSASCSSCLIIGGFNSAAVTSLKSVTSSIGFATRSSIKFQGSFTSSTVVCRSGSAAYEASVNSGGWYELSGLSGNTTYTFQCADTVTTSTFTARTLSPQLESMSATANFTQNGVTYNLSSCFTDQRMISYNPVTGSLDMAGETSGSPPNSCFATYNGVKWQFARLALPNESMNSGIDYNVGYGIAYLNDGTTVTRDTVLQNGGNYSRVNFCKANCGVYTNWTSVVLSALDTAGAPMNACTAAVTVNRSGTKIVVVNGCGTSDYTECSTSTDCTQLSSWSPPLQIGTAGNSTYPSPFWDANGGLWTVTAATSSVLYCPATANCQQLSSWRQGKLPSNVSPNLTTFFEQDGSVIRIVVVQDLSTTVKAASCDLNGAVPCGTVVSGVFTGFTVQTNTVNYNRLGMVFKTSNGYAIAYLDINDGYKTKQSTCHGTFSECFTDLSYWSTFTLLPDNQPHVWTLYMQRNGAVDADGSPFIFSNDSGETGLIYMTSM